MLISNRGQDIEDNRGRWFSPYNPDIKEPNNPADILTNYFNDCVLQKNFNNIFAFDENNNVQPPPDISSEDFIQAASYLICDMGSSYAAHTLTVYRELITHENAKLCFETLYDRYAMQNLSSKTFSGISSLKSFNTGHFGEIRKVFSQARSLISKMRFSKRFLTVVTTPSVIQMVACLQMVGKCSRS